MQKKQIIINEKKYNINYILKNTNNSNISLIECIETIGIYIPNFCYNQELSISGNCRMCVVEIKNSLKPIISCVVNTKSYFNNKIFTRSPLTFKFRESIIEFLLLNHPIDCTICDQAGECDLQDYALTFGTSYKRFYTYKRTVDDKHVGPVIKTTMTRCIHCTRCIRFGTEIAGLKEFGIFGRGVLSEVGLYLFLDKLTSELSGNLIDLCPVGSITKKSLKNIINIKKFFTKKTQYFIQIKNHNNIIQKFQNLILLKPIGALTGRPYPFIILRPWEHLFKMSIDFTNSFAQSLKVGIAYDKVRRSLPSFINEYDEDTPWINDKTRFSFEGAYATTYSTKTSSKKKKLFIQTIIILMYFYDHLYSRLSIKVPTVFFIFGNTISLELLSLLVISLQKYTFLKIRTLGVLPTNNDIETNYQINKSLKSLNNLTTKSDFCLLLGSNTRYEGSYLNLKLRKRYLKDNFKIVSFSSYLDITLPIYFLGSTFKTLNFFSAGINLESQNFMLSNSPLIILNSEFFRRNDCNSIFNIIETLKSYTFFTYKNWNGLNILNNSLNDVGINSINKFSNIKLIDLNHAKIFFLIDIPFYSFYLNKLIQLKILNFRYACEYEYIHKRKKYDYNCYIFKEYDYICKNINKRVYDMKFHEELKETIMKMGFYQEYVEDFDKKLPLYQKFMEDFKEKEFSRKLVEAFEEIKQLSNDYKEKTTTFLRDQTKLKLDIVDFFKECLHAYYLKKRPIHTPLPYLLAPDSMPERIPNCVMVDYLTFKSAMYKIMVVFGSDYFVHYIINKVVETSFSWFFNSHLFNNSIKNYERILELLDFVQEQSRQHTEFNKELHNCREHILKLLTKYNSEGRTDICKNFLKEPLYEICVNAVIFHVDNVERPCRYMNTDMHEGPMENDERIFLVDLLCKGIFYEKFFEILDSFFSNLTSIANQINSNKIFDEYYEYLKKEYDEKQLNLNRIKDFLDEIQYLSIPQNPLALELKKLYKKNATLDSFIFSYSPISQYNFINKFKEAFHIKEHKHLTSKNFYETSGTFQNAEGYIKKSLNVINSKKTVQEDWKLLRLISKNLNNLFFKNKQKNNIIRYDLKSIFNFKNYIALHFYAIREFNNLAFFYLSENSTFFLVTNKFFLTIQKNFNTKFKFCINDFYLGGYDLYSTHSKTMILCSNLLKKKSNTFIAF